MMGREDLITSLEILGPHSGITSSKSPKSTRTGKINRSDQMSTSTKAIESQKGDISKNCSIFDQLYGAMTPLSPRSSPRAAKKEDDTYDERRSQRKEIIYTNFGLALWQIHQELGKNRIASFKIKNPTFKNGLD